MAGLNAALRYNAACKSSVGEGKSPNDSDNNVLLSSNGKKENASSKKIIFPKETMIGALAKYISTENKNFQPMNANFGILPELPEKIKDKKLKYGKLADRAIEELQQYL